MGSFQQINMGFGSTVIRCLSTIKFLVVGGGGGGGTNWGSGGGGGGVVQGTIAVTPGSSLSITVGKGGCIASYGANSTISSTSPGFTNITAYGGGSGPPFGSGGACAAAGGAGGAGSPRYNIGYGYPSPACTFNTISGAQGYQIGRAHV